ncbi:hypothetical protein VNO78_33186 [Psophocarpus tetragonolobus]|uniref:Uncharacterized protein n=1 Tax=Psophocarpus tetragonolobus TaxID=3891 RepID=A0AAN9NWX1_PSOTE
MQSCVYVHETAFQLSLWKVDLCAWSLNVRDLEFGRGGEVEDFHLLDGFPLVFGLGDYDFGNRNEFGRFKFNDEAFGSIMVILGGLSSKVLMFEAKPILNEI